MDFKHLRILYIKQVCSIPSKIFGTGTKSKVFLRYFSMYFKETGCLKEDEPSAFVSQAAAVVGKQLVVGKDAPK